MFSIPFSTFRTTLLSIAAIFLLSTVAAATVPEQGAAVLAEAERFRAEKTFKRAHELYERAAKLPLSPEQEQWVQFGLADTAWRLGVVTYNRDSTDRDAARAVLQRVATKSAATWPRIAAEANESLGDYHRQYAYDGTPRQPLQWYLAALEYWAGSKDLAAARERYLSIVWRMSAQDQQGVPREVLEDATALAATVEERVHARFLLAQRLLREGGSRNAERAFGLLEEVYRQGRETKWYDAAVFAYGTAVQRWADARSRFGNQAVPPQATYAKAVELFRHIANDSNYRNEFQRRAWYALGELTKVSAEVLVSATFMPSSEQDFTVVWRDVKQLELTMYSVDLTGEPSGHDASRRWISTEGRPVVRNWTFETQTGQHEPGRKDVRLTPRLPVGAYYITGTARAWSSGNALPVAGALLLVTDAHIVVHSAGNQAKIFVSDVESGEPIANATVRVIAGDPSDSATIARTDARGLVELKLPRAGDRVVTASLGTRQAYLPIRVPSSEPAKPEKWQIHTFTDRPAYRPNETVRWKMIARTGNGDRWTTPSGPVEYEITGPRGQKVARGSATLNAFGSFWSEVALTPSMPLGDYSIRYTVNKVGAGYHQLFRLEEYKLPELIVDIGTLEGRQYRLGETIEATIDARYYFGGPVANAAVEAIVYRRRLHRSRLLPWERFWWDSGSPAGDYDPMYYDQEITTREMLRTDANGRAILRINTPRDGEDTTYRIEARVVDASRREVRGGGSVNVTRHRYSVLVQPEHYVHRPQERATVRFRLVDANGNPVQATGTVEVIRRRWQDGAYAEETILASALTSDARGEAGFAFTPKSTGYYAIRWTGIDETSSPAGDRITAETTIWVADRATTDVGYYDAGGVQLIVDKEAMRAGETSSVLVIVPAPGRWVLLTTGAETIFDTRVLRMEGTVQLVQYELDERHLPDFVVAASSVFDRKHSTASKHIVVPAVEELIDIEVKADREQYEPRQEGTLTITTRDHDGRPLSAEVALAVWDDAVTAIQHDRSGDPRRAFQRPLRHSSLNVRGGADSQRYVRRTAVEMSQKEKEAEALQRAQQGQVDVVLDPIPVGVTEPAYDYSSEMAVALPIGSVGGQLPSGVQVRSDFRSTAFWQPDIVTGADGTATVRFEFPEALTTWRATAQAATTGSAFGMATSTARTSLPLLVRLQAPRFFVAGDRVVVSAVINNNTGAAMSVTPSLEADGLTGGGGAQPAVEVPARGESRVEWTLHAERAGNAKLRVAARGAQYGDAMERSFVVYEHGIDKLVARSGKLRGSEAVVKLELPKERRATDLTVQIAPSLAVTMLDALPHLLESPYECTEQTMSRFVPAVVVARTLEKLGLDPKERLPKDLDAISKAGLERLYNTQSYAGAWGWCSPQREDGWMTAYVVWGLALARDAGLPVDPDAVDRAVVWLAQRFAITGERWNERAWLLHALAAWNQSSASEREKKAFEELWTNREHLSAYARTLLALTAHRYGDAERARVLLRNLEDSVKIDRAPDQSVLLKGETTSETIATARWGADRFWWRWYDGTTEATAFALQALVNIDPQNALIEPAMNWLVKNRRGAQWSNTRYTAIALLALNDYLEQSGELRGDIAYELTVNGQAIATKTVTAAEALRAPGRFSIDASVLKATTEQVRIRRTGGDGPIWFSAEARFVSLEEPMTAAGNELFVRREYFRLVPQPTLLKGTVDDEVPLRDGETVSSGERVAVVVTIDVKNDYEYLLFEDLKPAGLEAAELQSGASLYATNTVTKATAGVHQELRDRKVALFVDRLPQGVWQIRYTLRAEIPGAFHALPMLGQAMYVPDIRANGEEVRITVQENVER